MIRLLSVLVMMGAVSACSTAQHASDWNAWVDKTNASYTTDKNAVLKVRDAVYLKPGETAWLVGSESLSVLQPASRSSASIVFESAEPGAEAVSVNLSGEEPREFGSRLDDIELTDGDFINGGLSGFGTDDPRYAVFLYDADHPKAAGFEGLNFFPYDPAYRVEAVIDAKPEFKPVLLQTERGLVKQFFDVGTARFTMNGVEAELPLMSTASESGKLDYLFFTFMDDTTGIETYNIGRYLDVPLETGELPETLILDFNYAYNPLCSRSPHFNCPLVETVIPMAVRAGEKYTY